MRLLRIAFSTSFFIAVAVSAQQPSNAPVPAGDDQLRALSALQTECKYNEAISEPDPARQQALLEQAIACVDARKKTADAKARAAEAQAAQNRIIAKQNLRRQETLKALLDQASKDGSIQAQTPHPPPLRATAPPPPPAGHTAPPEIPTAPSAAGNTNSDAGQPAQQSAYATTNACDLGTDTTARANGQALLSVHRELLRQQDVQDDFGHRLGDRFLVYQVSVTNGSKDFQYSVSDISVDLEKILTLQGAQFTDAKGAPSPYAALHQASGETLDMLRGVPEKGQDLDPRNLTLHVLQGIGSVGAGVSGLTPFAGTMGSAMGNFNGAFLQALTGIAPDHTATQLNRLSDMAFSSNTLIGKLQTRTFAVFIPKTFVLTKDSAKAFHKDPRSLLNWLPLDQVNVCVDGILLVQVATTAEPSFSSDVPRVLPGASISISDATPSADIYFTTNGDTPTTASTKYSTALTVGNAPGAHLRIRAFAVAPNQSPSNTVDQTFTAAQAAKAPQVAQAADGKIILTPGAPDDSIYYTLDGTSPGVKSTPYSAPFALSSDQKVKVVKAIEIGNTTSYSSVTSFTPPATP